MAIIMRGTGKALPVKHVKNDDLPASLETNDEWIRSHTGIGARYLGNEAETSASLGAEACLNALKNAKVEVSEIDLIVCSTITPDYQGFPANSCLIQQKIGAMQAACFDVSIACTGFIVALDTAASMLERHNWKKAIVVSAEKLSKIADWNDRSTCVLFGDAAGAVVIENCCLENSNSDNTDACASSCSERGLGTVILGADGSGEKALYTDEKGFLRMDGRAVYNFAVKTITETIVKLAEAEGLTLDQIDRIVCHQANEKILKAAAKRLKIDESKFFFDMEEYGNTSSASIPVAFNDMVQQGQLQEGMTIITAGFGAGLSWGGALIRW